MMRLGGIQRQKKLGFGTVFSISKFLLGNSVFFSLKASAGSQGENKEAYIF